MSLPKWVGSENLCDCSGCDYAIKMHNALSIAWEALEEIKKAECEKYCDTSAAVAMVLIRELEK